MCELRLFSTRFPGLALRWSSSVPWTILLAHQHLDQLLATRQERFELQRQLIGKRLYGGLDRLCEVRQDRPHRSQSVFASLPRLRQSRAHSVD